MSNIFGVEKNLFYRIIIQDFLKGIECEARSNRLWLEVEKIGGFGIFFSMRMGSGAVGAGGAEFRSPSVACGWGVGKGWIGMAGAGGVTLCWAGDAGGGGNSVG